MRAILISPDEEIRSQFEDAALHNAQVRLSKIFDVYPDSRALSRAVRAWVPEVVFLDIQDQGAAEEICLRLEKEFPTIQRVAVHRSLGAEIYRQVLQLRMSELLVPPFHPDELIRVLATVTQHLEIQPAKIGSTDRCFAFLPAKPGVGTSTIAANASWAFSQLPDTKVLLADFDISSGVTGFVFNVEHEYHLADAAQRIKNMDDETWQRLVRNVDGIDLLLSGAPRVEEAASGEQVRQLMEFARRNYDVISVDLPDRLGESSMAVLNEANRIFVVATPELAPLRLARLKALTLRTLGVEHKACLLINRASDSRSLDNDEIESTVGLPICASFPSYYHEVTRSIEKGRPSSSLAPHIEQFAHSVLDRREPEKRNRFIERFGLVALRYQFR